MEQKWQGKGAGTRGNEASRIRAAVKCVTGYTYCFYGRLYANRGRYGFSAVSRIIHIKVLLAKNIKEEAGRKGRKGVGRTEKE